MLCKIFKREPERTIPTSKEINFIQPRIIEIDAPVKTHGKYKTKSGMPRGLVVHFTAGRSENGKSNGVNSLMGLASNGLGCFTMDADGVIYKSKHQGWDDTAYHAGKSEWKGKSSVSSYCMGMEICNAGKLDAEGKSWFGVKYEDSVIREITEAVDNQEKGKFHKYTEAQEKSLTEFIMWQLSTNPEFSIDWVVGHDECAVPLGRKPDPGGSFSFTMPKYREYLVEELKKRSTI